VVRYDAAPPAASNALSPNAGLGFAVRDPDGRIAACAGVGFLVEGVAQIAFLHTREDCRRRGLARVVLAQCVRALEETGRTRVLAEIPCDDTAALRLFASLLFRGRARVRSFRLEVP
jgi:ribosomal protein S18 acetylase RimI-like enzyme